MNTCALLRLVLILCLAPGLRAEVLEVPGVFGSVQAAVDAAVAGDVVVVAPGASAESVVVDGKGIILVGDGDMLKLVRLMVTNVPAGQIAVIRNVSVPHVGYTPTLSGEALRLVDNVGSVWVEDCSFRGMHGFEGTATTADPPVNGAPGAVVMGCKDVALLRSQFVGGAGAAFFPARDPLSATSGGPGLSITDSRVAVDGGLTRGNDGGDGQVLGAVNGGHGGLGITCGTPSSSRPA